MNSDIRKNARNFKAEILKLLMNDPIFIDWVSDLPQEQNGIKPQSLTKKKKNFAHTLIQDILVDIYEDYMHGLHNRIQYVLYSKHETRHATQADQAELSEAARRYTDPDNINFIRYLKRFSITSQENELQVPQMLCDVIPNVFKTILVHSEPTESRNISGQQDLLHFLIELYHPKLEKKHYVPDYKYIVNLLSDKSIRFQTVQSGSPYGKIQNFKNISAIERFYAAHKMNRLTHLFDLSLFMERQDWKKYEYRINIGTETGNSSDIDINAVSQSLRNLTKSKQYQKHTISDELTNCLKIIIRKVRIYQKKLNKYNNEYGEKAILDMKKEIFPHTEKLWKLISYTNELIHLDLNEHELIQLKNMFNFPFDQLQICLNDLHIIACNLIHVKLIGDISLLQWLSFSEFYYDVVSDLKITLPLFEINSIVMKKLILQSVYSNGNLLWKSEQFSDFLVKYRKLKKLWIPSVNKILKKRLRETGFKQPEYLHSFVFDIPIEINSGKKETWSTFFLSMEFEDRESPILSRLYYGLLYKFLRKKK